MFGRKADKLLIEKLKKCINNLEDENKEFKIRIREKDKTLKIYQEEHEILLENASELRKRINSLRYKVQDLQDKLLDRERKITFLANNLPKSKKERILKELDNTLNNG